MNRSMLVCSFVLLLLVSQANAATLSGSLYDLNLDKLENVIIRIGDEQYISKNGDYRFDLETGKYIVIAAQFDENQVLIKSSKETINIEEDKNYFLDLILIESFDEESNLFSVLDNLEFSVEGNNNSWLLWIILIIIALGGIVFILANKRIQKSIQQFKEDAEKRISEAKSEVKQEAKEAAKEHIEKEVEKVKLELKATRNLDKSLKEVVEFIAQEGGRTTQTEIRAKFPSSEAKISLMITELEHKGIVKRIKKGRGNVIVLEDK